MKDVVFNRLCLFGLGVIYGWHALGALRSGKVTFYQRFGRAQNFSRATNPLAFWIVVCVYLIFAAFTVVAMPLTLLHL